jgi:ABC-type sugar transport system ATPase subunit
LSAIADVEGRVFIFNEPTEGVDVGGRADMWVVIRDLAERGAGVIVSSSDMDELMQLSDYICVMRHGRIVHEGPRTQYTEDAVLHHMLGADDAK